jgi:hypothetical protein
MESKVGSALSAPAIIYYLLTSHAVNLTRVPSWLLAVAVGCGCWLWLDILVGYLGWISWLDPLAFHQGGAPRTAPGDSAAERGDAGHTRAQRTRHARWLHGEHPRYKYPRSILVTSILVTSILVTRILLLMPPYLPCPLSTAHARVYHSCCFELAYAAKQFLLFPRHQPHPARRHVRCSRRQGSRWGV